MGKLAFLSHGLNQYRVLNSRNLNGVDVSTPDYAVFVVGCVDEGGCTVKILNRTPTSQIKTKLREYLGSEQLDKELVNFAYAKFPSESDAYREACKIFHDVGMAESEHPVMAEEPCPHCGPAAKPPVGLQVQFEGALTQTHRSREPAAHSASNKKRPSNS